ncbi:MAG: Hpt domain-containing protein, partial [Pseudoalteromonas shioyasakiensis]
FKMYLEQSNQLSKEVNNGVIEQDVEAIASACHQLKSISKTIGAMKVAELAAEFEKRCKEDELSSDDLIELRDSYEIEYSKVAQFLKEQIQRAEQEATH